MKGLRMRLLRYLTRNHANRRHRGDRSHKYQDRDKSEYALRAHGESQERRQLASLSVDGIILASYRVRRNSPHAPVENAPADCQSLSAARKQERNLRKEDSNEVYRLAAAMPVPLKSKTFDNRIIWNIPRDDTAAMNGHSTSNLYFQMYFDTHSNQGVVPDHYSSGEQGARSHMHIVR